MMVNFRRFIGLAFKGAITISLFTANGTLAVEDIHLKDSITEVYNFEVENTHIYTVGAHQLVVHNDCQDVVNSLLESNRINPDDVTSFIGDFQYNTNLLNMFESGELSVDAWRVLSEGGSTLRTSEDAIRFFARIDDSPALSNKLLTDLEDFELATFVEDFGDITSANRANFEGNVELVESWRVLLDKLPSNRSIWRNNMSHIEFCSHPDVKDALEWLRNPINNKLTIFDDYPNLNPGEIIALNYYTHRGDQINNYLRTGLNSVDPQYFFTDIHASTFQSFLNAALSKLPSYSVPSGIDILRGTSQFESNLLLNLNVGDEYIPPFYYSTTTNKNVAIQRTFAGQSPGTAIVQISNTNFTGVDISPFSRYQEQEILFKLNTKFERGGLLPPEFSVNQELPEIIIIPKMQ